MGFLYIISPFFVCGQYWNLLWWYCCTIRLDFDYVMIRYNNLYTMSKEAEFMFRETWQYSEALKNV